MKTQDLINLLRKSGLESIPDEAAARLIAHLKTHEQQKQEALQAKKQAVIASNNAFLAENNWRTEDYEAACSRLNTFLYASQLDKVALTEMGRCFAAFLVNKKQQNPDDDLGRYFDFLVVSDLHPGLGYFCGGLYLYLTSYEEVFQSLLCTEHKCLSYLRQYNPVGQQTTWQSMTKHYVN